VQVPGYAGDFFCGPNFGIGLYMPSSVVRAIKYDAPSHTLRVVYVSGNIYDYLEVPETVYKKMRTAESKGEFLNTRIKGHYAFQRIK